MESPVKVKIQSGISIPREKAKKCLNPKEKSRKYFLSYQTKQGKLLLFEVSYASII